MKNCEWDEDTLVAYVWGELDERTERKLAAHVESCERCRERVRVMERAKRGLKDLSGEAMPDVPSLWPGIKREVSRRRHRVPTWAWPAAAALLIGLTLFLKRAAQQPTPPSPQIERFAVLEARLGDRDAQVFVFSPNDSVTMIWLQ